MSPLCGAFAAGVYTAGFSNKAHHELCGGRSNQRAPQIQSEQEDTVCAVFALGVVIFPEMLEINYIGKQVSKWTTKSPKLTTKPCSLHS